MFQRVEQPGVGAVLAARTPLDFVGRDRLPAAVAQPSGTDTAAVLGEVLGLDGAALAALVSDGVIPG
jgi:crotonobetainyl-CoA:carnitine CoA-transferase CaiB-like acyl-CoA transferase